MSEEDSTTCKRGRLRNRIEVTRRDGFTAECNVALRANKRRALVPLVYLVIENSAFVERCGNVAAFRAATRFHRHFPRHVTRLVHHGHVVTLRALQIRMHFMSKRAG